MTREGVQGAEESLNLDTMSDSTGSGSGSDEEECNRPRATHKGKSDGDDPLELFSACVSAWNDRSAKGDPAQSGKDAGGDGKRKRKDRRVHRSADERKQVSARSRAACGLAHIAARSSPVRTACSDVWKRIALQRSARTTAAKAKPTR